METCTAVTSGDSERAWNYLQAAIALAPGRPLLLADLADLAEDLGRYEELAELVQSWQAVEGDQISDLQARPHQCPFIFPNKHFRHQRARVVGAGLDGAICTGRHDREQIAWPGLGHFALKRQEIARFANWAGHIGDDAGGIRSRLAHRTDVVMGFVERRPNEIIHPGIDDDEHFGFAALEVEHASQQDARIADDQTPRLEDERAVKVARRALDHSSISLGMRRRLVVLAVGNSEPAAEIHIAPLLQQVRRPGT